MNKEVLEQLNSIREEIEKEQVSYGEIAYLQDHKQEVLETGDVLLCQWAGISEDEYNTLDKSVQKCLDETTAKADVACDKKVAEIMEV